DVAQSIATVESVDNRVDDRRWRADGAGLTRWSGTSAMAYWSHGSTVCISSRGAGAELACRHLHLCDHLLICAFNTALMCRVSTQITGKPASARALISHCDSGPASNPIRLK